MHTHVCSDAFLGVSIVALIDDITFISPETCLVSKIVIVIFGTVC